MEKRGGMLRYGNDMRLEKVEKPSLDMAIYQLPANVTMMAMPDMGKMPAAGRRRPRKKKMVVS
ncbi:MAG: hypothetical protein WCD88_09800 [Desulfobacterales bacterium]